MTLILTNNVTKKSYSFTVSDAGDSRLFYHFTNFQVEDKMDDGQYSYELKDEDDKQIASGVLQIGDYKNTNKAYVKNNSPYKQYEP